MRNYFSRRLGAKQIERQEALQTLKEAAVALAGLAADAQRKINIGRGRPYAMRQEIQDMLDILDAATESVHALQTQRGGLDWARNL